MPLPDARRRDLPVAIAAWAVACGACGEPAPQVRLVAVGCARPAGATLVRITAFGGAGERSESLGIDESATLSSFPADTEQLGVEVVIGGGAIGAAGKSAPLVFDALGDGATIPVVLAPPDGFCEVGAMTEPRARPLVAIAGDGVLVVGGTGPLGPLSTAEYYDRATATFSAVEVPPVLVDDAQGFAGAALATLRDGRVALIGGPHSAFVVFDPRTRTFATDPALIDARAFHAAIAVGDDEVLVAGGCSAVAGGACAGVPRRQMLRYRVTKIGAPEPVTLLPQASQRIAPQLFDVGVQLDGRRGYVLAGGAGDPGQANRFALGDELATALTGSHAQAAALDGGAVLAAFAEDAAPVSGAAIVIPPSGAVVPVARAADARGVRLIALEDGRVVGFGGDAAGRVTSYDPTRDAWTVAAPGAGAQPGALTAPALARLADGTVLVVGGAVAASAWVYRPSLVGPASGSVSAVPLRDAGLGVLTASDPSTVSRETMPGAWVLRSPGEALTARALVGGPRLARGSVRANVHVRGGGLALIAQQLGPGEAVVGELRPDAPARITIIAAGARRVACEGAAPLPAFSPASAATAVLAIEGGRARLSLDDRELAACDVGASARGAWGVGALGAGAEVAVDLVTVAR